MKFTILIATYNRAADLRDTLASLASLRPEGPVQELDWRGGFWWRAGRSANQHDALQRSALNCKSDIAPTQTGDYA